MKYLIFSSLFLISTLSAFAQTRTVTNADLEKYRQARVKAEREYRENYQRLGMPSPEELRRRNEESARKMTELSERLRLEEAENERLNTFRQQSEAVQRQSFYYALPNNQIYYVPNYLYGYPSSGYYNNGYQNRVFRQNYQKYDNATRLWSFTNIQTNAPRYVNPRLIIKPPPRR